MGSPPDEPGRFPDETRHPVKLTRAFELCDHLVTQAEWDSTMGWDDSQFTGPPDRPVENVTWFDCILYCNQGSLIEGLTPAYTVSDQRFEGHHLVSAYVTWNEDADGDRLPTEAEFEYACRAGGTTAFSNGPISVHETGVCREDSVLDAIGWYCANSGRQTHDVKSKPPNAWGLYDMEGNVQQWIWDWFEDATADSVTDPTGPATGFLRVWCGGGWDYDPRHCRCADRGRDQPEGFYPDIGMRICRNTR